MKPKVKKLPVMLTTFALAGQLTLPAAALTAVQPNSYEGSINITEVFHDRNLQAWLLNSSNLLPATSAKADRNITLTQHMDHPDLGKEAKRG